MKKNYLYASSFIIIFILYSAFGDREISKKSFRNNHLYEKKPSQQFPNTDLLENGDILFRRGYGVDSTVAMNFSEGEKRYSHAGIVYIEKDKIYIIHSEDEDDKRNGVFKEELNTFIDDSPIWAVYRFNMSDKVKETIITQALILETQNILFDNDFNLDEDKKMYCSEFIYKVVNRSANEEIIHAGKRFMSRTFVTISNLYENKYSKLVQSSHKKIKE